MATNNSLPVWEDDAYYVVKLRRSTVYPPGSNNMLPVGAHLTMRGRAARVIEKDIASAQLIASKSA